VLMLFIFVESFSYFFCVYQPTQTDAQKIFAQQLPRVIPLSSKVLWSILSSTIIEVLKKRWALLEMICPKLQNKETSELEGMPPAYIVVEMSWEDPDDDTNKLEEMNDNNIDRNVEDLENMLDNQIEKKKEDFIQNYWRTCISTNIPRYRLWPEHYSHFRLGTCLLTQLLHRAQLCNGNGFCQSQLEMVNLSEKYQEMQCVPREDARPPILLPFLTALRPASTSGLYLGSYSSNHSALTKNMKGIWYILAGKFNIFLANSAVGVAISLAFINAQDIIDETKEDEIKSRENAWRKVKKKTKFLSDKKQKLQLVST